MRIPYPHSRASSRSATTQRILLFPVLLILLGGTVPAVDSPELPSGPSGPGRFGAYYTNLPYTPEWDATWRMGPDADVVVRFDKAGHRLIFWHGTNYVPFWVNDRGFWYSDGAVVRPGAGPHQDKVCRYSFADVVESNDARVVVRWRYAPADETGEVINADPMTNWNDWVDEFYTIYPDATGVRSVTLHSSSWDSPLRCRESILINQAGQEPLEAEAATIGSVSDKRNIQIVDLPGGKHFQVVSDEGPIVEEGAPFKEIWRDWPATGAEKRPGCRFLNNIQWKPSAEDRTSKSWIMLVGLTGGGEKEITATAKSWLSAPNLAVAGEAFSFIGYDAGEKAYKITCIEPGSPSALKLTIQAGPERPVVNPAFVIKGWGKADLSVAINGEPGKRGGDFRYGFRKTDTGCDLIVWIELTAVEPTSVEIAPLPVEKD